MSEQFKAGDQIVRIPDHANGNPNHPDSEKGYVTSINEETGMVYCRYYNENGTLRTKANSEGCDPRYLHKITKTMLVFGSEQYEFK